MSRIDIIICILPKIRPDAPTVGPNILKAHAEKHGHKVLVEDLNIELYVAMERRGDHAEYYGDNDHVFAGNNTRVTDEFSLLMDRYAELVDSWIERWRQANPRYIGLSIFSRFSQQIGMYLSQLIRQRLPHIKIVWGGAYIGNWIKPHFNDGLLDHFIRGDGENSLLALLNGDLTAPGIDKLSPNQINVNEMSVPDYSDINWDLYKKSRFGETPIYITASRGCVKRCTFCDVYQIWPEYRYRSGENIAAEIIALRKKWNRNTFMFTDSLINGSMKAFREMMTCLIEYRKQDSDWNWISQYIIRPKKQNPESDFEMMRASGCNWIDIGIESFSKDVRWHMGKKFTDEDMWYTFSMLRKHGIGASLLGFIGYPTETEADHAINLDTLRKIHKRGYFTTHDNGSVLRPSFISTLLLDPDTPLGHIIKDELQFEDSMNWTYRENTPAVRYRRYQEFHETLEYLIGQEYHTDIGTRNRKNYKKKIQGVPVAEGAAF